MSTPTTITERSRANLPLRDYVIITCVIVGWLVYADRRFSSLENGREALQREVEAVRADRAADNAKLDRVLETITDVRTSVARIEERTRKN